MSGLNKVVKVAMGETLPVRIGIIQKIREFYMVEVVAFIRIARYIWKHRNEKDCRQKRRRMARELLGKKAFI